jgi:hypothetical protein
LKLAAVLLALLIRITMPAEVGFLPAPPPNLLILLYFIPDDKGATFPRLVRPFGQRATSYGRRVTAGARRARFLPPMTPHSPRKSTESRQSSAQLTSDEAFFSIEAYGPFAVKEQGGRSLQAPGQRHLVQQWQRSRGSVTMAAAFELSSNQVGTFYCDRKSTSEMIRMMKLLADQYKDRKRIFLSWMQLPGIFQKS